MSPGDRRELTVVVKALEGAGRVADETARRSTDKALREYHRGAASAYTLAARHLRDRFGL